MSDYTPTADEIRRIIEWRQKFARDRITVKAFDRWLASLDKAPTVPVFTCGIRISCAIGPCGFTACANPAHREYRGEDPHEAMSLHRSYAHSIGHDAEST